MATFVTSDPHFGHDKDFVWKVRGFNSVSEMNEAIIQRWNSVVGPEDVVYLLGDALLGDIETGLRCLKRLNGNIHIVLGNHDTNAKVDRYYECPNVQEIEGYATLIKYKKFSFYLSHYPTITANIDDSNKPLYRRVINLYGHTHQTTNFYCNSYTNYHVGMDSHNCTPVLLDDIIEEIKAEFEKRNNQF